VPSGELDASIRATAVGGLADAAIGLARGTELWLEGGGASSDSTLAIGLKQVIARGGAWRLALEASARRLSEQGTSPYQPLGTLNFGPAISGSADTFGLAAIGSVCVNECRVFVSGGVAGAVMPGAGEQPSAALLYAWLAASAGTDRVRGLAEISAFPSADADMFGVIGVRATWRHVALEGGIGYASIAGPIALPIIGLAYRP
jgi:hypothetical protein